MAAVDHGPWISGGKVFGRCARCNRIVRINKPVIGSAHTCLTDCEVAGHHLKLRTETRGWWIFASTWRVCDQCRVEMEVE